MVPNWHLKIFLFKICIKYFHIAFGFYYHFKILRDATIIFNLILTLLPHYKPNEAIHKDGYFSLVLLLMLKLIQAENE